MEPNKIYNEDCLQTLARMPDGFIDCCVTSPPYYGLRDYGTATWEGGDAECNHSAAKIKTRYDYSLDSSLIQDGKRTGTDGGQYKKVCPNCGAVNIDEQIGLEETPEAYVQKLVAVFREVKRALKEDGTLWLNLGDSYWGGKGQSGQAWSTNNQDRETLQKAQHQIAGTKETRPTDRKHDIIKPKDLIGIPWMVAFALRADGWYLRQDIIWHKPNPMPESVTDRCTKSHEYIFLLSKSKRYFYDHEAVMEKAAYDGRKDTVMKGSIKYANGFGPTDSNPQSIAIVGHERWKNKIDGDIPARNKRSVWTVTTKPFSEAHFATFPEDLIVPCIKAGCPEGGLVYDPFGGAATTALVSHKLRRNWIMSELSADYVKIAQRRLDPHIRQLFLF
jgi:DNA modification methylase